MSTGHTAAFSPELMDKAREDALRGALERLYDSKDLAHVWPAAHDAREGGSPIPLEEVRIVVLPLDRIGAPAGASGASVYVAYYTHLVDPSRRRKPSTPVVVKIGLAKDLDDEMKGARAWPGLSPGERAKFAFPLCLDGADPERAVLVAPFQSIAQPEQDGSRNEVEVRDLWRLLEDKGELASSDDSRWEQVGRLVGEALDAVEPAHACGMARPPRASASYAEDYGWYLRQTRAREQSRHVVVGLFGKGAEVAAFGQTWPNPIDVVDAIVDDQLTFEGVRGAVHGDLHPKNVVIGPTGHVQVIDFGWASRPKHVVVDYVLLDLNLRGTTLPSQIDEAGLLSLAGFLDSSSEHEALHPSVRQRARIIKQEIWERASARVVRDWEREYLVPLLLVGYGLLVHLDKARNQTALVATVLQLSKRLKPLLSRPVAP